MDEQNGIIINGNRYAFENGETILDVAERNQIDIPTLCFLKGATPRESCGVCMVEIRGQKELVKACSTEAVSDMDALTESDRVVTARRFTINKMLGSGNHNCAIRGSNTSDWASFS